MTIVAVNWLSLSTNLLLVVHVVVCLLLCLLVLMQRPKQEGLGAAFGGGMTDQAFGAKTTDVLQKGTVYLGSIFFVITLVLAILVSARSKGETFVNETEAAKQEQVSNEETQEAVTDALKDLAAAADETVEETTQKAADVVEKAADKVETAVEEAGQAAEQKKEEIEKKAEELKAEAIDKVEQITPPSIPANNGQ